MYIVTVNLPNGTVLTYTFDDEPTQDRMDAGMEHIGGRPKR